MSENKQVVQHKTQYPQQMETALTVISIVVGGVFVLAAIGAARSAHGALHQDPKSEGRAAEYLVAAGVFVALRVIGGISRSMGGQ